MNGNPSTPASAPTIGVDIFKEQINAMENEINTNINQNLVNVTATMDKIATRIQQQDLKICDLEQRVETLEKHITYADAAKLPPQRLPQPNTSTNTKTNAITNTNKKKSNRKMIT